jgi:hypothetical protein
MDRAVTPLTSPRIAIASQCSSTPWFPLLQSHAYSGSWFLYDTICNTPFPLASPRSFPFNLHLHCGTYGVHGGTSMEVP